MDSEVRPVEDDSSSETQKVLQTPSNKGSADGVLSKGNTISKPRSQTIPSASLNTSSPGTTFFELDRRRIIWEARKPPADNDEEDEVSDYSEDLSRPVIQTPNSSPREYRPTSSASTLSQSTSYSPERLRSPREGDMLLSKLERFSSPCQIRWMSTETISFDATRGLRNSWNEDKEVHVARNVTAVDPQAGHTLLRLWRAKAEAAQNQRFKDACSKAWGV